MGKKSQYWHWSIILIFIMICSVLLQAANQVFAKNPSEIQGENKAVQYVLKKTFDKDKASVELSLDMKEKEKIEIDKVLLPDGKEHAYNGSGIQTVVSKNGTYQFRIFYKKEKMENIEKPDELETLSVDIPVEVTEIKEETAKNETASSSKTEKTTTKEKLAKSSLLKAITNIDTLNNSIIAAKDGEKTTLTIDTSIDVEKEIVIPDGKIIHFAGNGSLKRTSGLDKKAHMIKIEEGGQLYLDGITVDGNKVGERYQTGLRVASAIEVLGNFTMISGNMTQHTCYVIHVSGKNAEFTMTGGTIKNNDASSGVFLEDHADFIMNGGEISNNVFDNYTDMEVNTIFLRNGSKFVLNDGLIANNRNSDLSCEVFVEGGRNGRNEDASSFIMNGGEISNNYSSYLSGAVTVGTWLQPDYKSVASFEMNGGVISKNTSRYAGGGVLIICNGDFKMNQGQITDNQAPVGGGIAANDGFISSDAGNAGFKIEEWGTTYHCPASFTMNGGVVSGNSTNEALNSTGGVDGVGGGIYLATNMGTFNAGVISNNTARDQGGGIYVASVPYQLQMYNTLIIDNTASLLGGGIWTCPTGSVKILVNNGGALFGNTAETDAAGDDFVSVPRASDYTTTFSDRMLGAGKVSYYRDGGVVAEGVLGQPDLSIPRFDPNNSGDEIKDISNSLEGYALKTVTAKNAEDMARKQATVIVTGNKAKRGGGIGANGSVVIGTEDNGYNLSVKKKWNTASGTVPKSITVDLIKIDENDNKTILETVKLSEENHWEYTFKDLPTQYTYDIKEHKVSGFKTKYEKTQDGNEIKFLITNTQATVTKSVTKIWDDKEDQDGIRPSEIFVQLYAGDKIVGEAVKLSSDNQWSYTWTELAKFEDGKEIKYSIKETKIPDGYTGKVEINKDGNFILTNTHQVKSIEPTEASEPEEPRKPKKASQPDKLKYVSKNPQTSDSGQFLRYIFLCGVTASILFVSFKKKK